VVVGLDNETDMVHIPDNSNPFFAEMARAIEQAGFAEGYNVVLCNSGNLEDKELAYIELLLSKRVDGLILCPSKDHPETLDVVLAAHLPAVVVDRAAGDLPVDQVLSDNEQGGYLAGQYLMQLGHRQMGCIANPCDVRSSVGNRLVGFQRALAEAGVELAPEAVIHSNIRYGGEVAMGEAAMGELLNRNLDLTAVFATNDLMAAGAVNTLRRANFQVPDDVSVIGFDNSLQAIVMYPSITTIAQPINELGQVSVSLLVERIKNPTASTSYVMLPTTLIERESCRAITTSV
jgi:LacI family transcriptional regulator